MTGLSRLPVSSGLLPSVPADAIGGSHVLSSSRGDSSGLVNLDESSAASNTPVLALDGDCSIPRAPITHSPIARRPSSHGTPPGVVSPTTLDSTLSTSINGRLPTLRTLHDSSFSATDRSTARSSAALSSAPTVLTTPTQCDGAGLLAASTACSRSSSRGDDLEPSADTSDGRASVHGVVPRESHLPPDTQLGVPPADVETHASGRPRTSSFSSFPPSNLAVNSNSTQNAVQTIPSAESLPEEASRAGILPEEDPFDATREYSTADMVFFWKPPSVFCQWTPSPFQVDGVNYNCAEQFFASEKARLFGDVDALRRIMEVSDPSLHKRYGRAVRGFDSTLWESERENIVLTASYAKFSQNPAMRHHLLATGEKCLVEASPYDSIWGVGLRADNPHIRHSPSWRGLNLLGSALQKVRHMLRFHTFPPKRSARLSSFGQSAAPASTRIAVHEVHPSTHQRLEASTLPTSERFPSFSSHAAHVPSDHDEAVWTVSSDENPFSTVSSPFAPHATHVPSDHDASVWTVSPVDDPTRSVQPLIPEQGPGLVGGVITVDDKSYTTQIQTHCGSATSTFGCVALLDTGSPQSFISARTWASMKASGAASAAFEKRTQPRCWGGFGKSAPLQTSTMVRLSVQFLRKKCPTASLAVWAYLVDDSVMQHDVLLGHDSWMRFTERAYRTLPVRRPGDRVFGELTLGLHSETGATAFIHDVSETSDNYQLRYAGQWPIQLHPEHQLVQVELVRSDGSPALVGNYLVDMLPQTAMFSSEEHFVSNGRQRIPLAGVSFLQPGDVLGLASAPLLQIPLSAVPRDDLSEELPSSSEHSSEDILGPVSSGDGSSVSPTSDPFVYNLHERPDGSAEDVPDASSPDTSRSSPPTTLLERLTPDQRTSFSAMWEALPPHLREITFNLQGPGWTPEVITDLGNVLREYHDVFSSSPTDFGSCSLFPFKLTVPPGSAPVTSRPYRVNPPVAKQVDAILDQYLAAGLIQHSTSPYSSPLVVIPKKSGGVRITVNYRKLNKLCELSQLPIPRVDDTLDKLLHGKIYSLFDMKSSFHQITVHRDTIPLTAFITSSGLFEWLKMPQGSAAAPGWFCKVVNEVIKNLENVASYLDDLIVFDADPAAHIATMRNLFKRLRKHNLKLSPPKATIGATEADFLGHTISPDGVRPNSDKVAALTKMPMPKTVKQLRALLGGLSYYRKFLPNLAKKIRSLSSLLKKEAKFVFTDDMESIVRGLLADLAAPPVLVYPDWDAVADGSRPFLLYCDASIDGFGGTLEQKQPDGSIRPIVYISRATLVSERHWTPLDLEGGSVIWCVKRLRGYLWGTHFHIYTDHKALEHFAKVGENNARVLRWLEFLSAYSYTLEYRKGSANGNADFLSRLPMAATEHDRSGRNRLTPTDDDDFVHLVQALAPPIAVGDSVHLVRSCGRTPRGDHAKGIGLGGLNLEPSTGILGGLPLSDSDFADFRQRGPQIPSLGSSPHVWLIRDLTPTVFDDSSASATRDRPPLVSSDSFQPFSSDVFAIDEPSVTSLSQAHPRQSLSPSEVISTRTRSKRRSPPVRLTLDPSKVISNRTRNKSAAAAGFPRPPVDYGFDLPDDPSPTTSTLVSVPEERAALPVVLPPIALAPPLLPTPTGVTAPLSVPVSVSPSSVSDQQHALPATNPSHSVVNPSSLDTVARSSFDSSLSTEEMDFYQSVENFSHLDWAREQRNEPECAAAIRYLQLGQPSVLPVDFFADVPRAHRTPFSEIRALAHKGRLYTSDHDIVLLVRKPTEPPSSSRPRGRAACLLNDEPIRIYVPMLMRPWIMHLCHAGTSGHFGAARTLRMLERFYWWVGMDTCSKWWVRHCLRCQARKKLRQTVRWPILSIPLPSGPGISVSVDYFGPLPTTPRGKAYILLFTDRFSRRADMYSVTATEFTAEGTADIFVNRYIPLWGCPVSLLSDNGTQFCSKLSQAVYKLLGVRKVATSSYHPNGNGGVERVNHTMAQMLAMVVNERQDDWDIHLPHVESAYNNSTSEATGLAPNEVHMNRLPRLPLTVIERQYARGHQSLDRDQVEYCDLAADRQRRSYAMVRAQHRLSVSRIERRNSALGDALSKLPVYAVGGWVWVYNSESTIRQGVRSGTDDKVLKAKLSLLWTGPFKILAVGPSPKAPDGSPLAANLLYLDLPSDLPGKDSKRRVSVARCKPCVNPHDTEDIPRFLPAGLTRYVLNDNLTKSPPYHVTGDDVYSDRLEVKQITGHQSVRGRGGVIAVLYKTHWSGLPLPSWEREMDLQRFRHHILQYWAGTPDQHRQHNRRYRAMRIGSALRELARLKGRRHVPSGYALVSRSTWDNRFASTILPIGAFFWYKAQDGFWWLGKISGAPSPSDCYIVRFLDEPGPVKIVLPPIRYTTNAAAVSGSWCLQVHKGSPLFKGLLRNVDMSRGAGIEHSLGDDP